MKFKDFYLKEYFTEPISYLKKYLSMSEDEKVNSLPLDFDYLWGKFVDFNHINDEPYKDIVDDNVIDAEELQKIDPKIYTMFGYWLKDYAFADPSRYGVYEADIPTFMYLDYTGDVINKWLIHFVDEPDNYEIAKEGFKYGTEDASKLGLTTWSRKEAKKFGGYNFAYRAEDAAKNWNSRRGEGKYGSDGVIFMANGLLCYHNGDEEHQVIFNGKDAKYIIPFTKEDDKLVIKNWKTDRNIVSFDYLKPINMINWLKDNYSQYVSVLHK